jgi:hypothetical protein
LSFAAAGCGGSSSVNNCDLTALSIAPQTATASHTAAAPGNQQQFIASPVIPKGCIPPPLPFAFATWSVSDSVNVSISNLKDQNNGNRNLQRRNRGNDNCNGQLRPPRVGRNSGERDSYPNL